MGDRVVLGYGFTCCLGGSSGMVSWWRGIDGGLAEILGLRMVFCCR